MELDRDLIPYEEPAPESTDLLSSAWCSSAIQVLQTGPKECSMALVEHPVMALGDDRNDMLAKSDRSLVVDNSSFSTTQWKYDDLKSWIWLQKAIHPELDYDLCLKKKWQLPRKMAPWNGGISLKKWVKERKQKRKEEARLQRAEVHAAVSVAGVAAALAAIAAENAAPPRAPGMRETAVASAAALVAAQCAKVAEAAGASRDQVAAAVDAARASTDASSVITLTAAAATSLRGAATLRGRRSAAGGGGGGGHERAEHAGPAALSQDDLDFDFNHARSRAALAKGDELFVAMPDGKWKLHTVSAASNKRGEIVLRVKKTNALAMAFSHAKESVIRDVRPCAPEKRSHDEGATYPVEVTTSKGKVELRADDYGVYKRWVATLSHMLVMSTAVSVSVSASARHDPPRPARRD